MNVRSNVRKILDEASMLEYMQQQGNAVGLAQAMNAEKSMFTDVYWKNGERYSFLPTPARGHNANMGNT